MQSQSEGRADNLYADTLDKGADAVRAHLEESRRKGYRYVVLDALSQDHLDTAAKAVQDMPPCNRRFRACRRSGQA